MLGRASEDPIANLDALRRVGIQFTLAQKDQITTLQNMGRGIEAFNAILDEADKKVGGLGKSLNKGMAGALDRLGLAWTETLETMGDSALYRGAVNTIQGLAKIMENFTVGVIAMRGAIDDLFDRFKSELVVSIDLPPPKPQGPLSVGPITPAPPSHFEKALIDVHISIKRSMMDLNSEREKLQHGFSLMSPEILKLAERFKVLPNIIKVLKGDFSELTEEERKMVNITIKASDALLDLSRKKEAAAIFRETRTELENYNIELRRLIFLHDNAFISTDTLVRKQEKLRAVFGDTRTALVKYNEELRRFASFYKAGAISANDFAIKQRELRATLESTTPELNILTSASEKFGDSLADLVVKGEGFSAGLKSIFKSLVDDIIKQFFKLSVINPILNGIFGESASRPQMGSQGGGMTGLGGVGGLLGKMMGNEANDNGAKEALGAVAGDFREEGRDQAKDYGKVLGETNKKMGKAGAEGASGLGNMFSNIAGGVASAAGGTIGSFLGNAFADLIGFQHGGSFKVGGSGGRDSQLVAFKASPREKVSIETPNQQSRGGNDNVTYIDARGVDPGQMDKLIQIIKDLDESVEIRAVNATADARDRNPSLFGRIS